MNVSSTTRARRAGGRPAMSRVCLDLRVHVRVARMGPQDTNLRAAISIPCEQGQANRRRPASRTARRTVSSGSSLSSHTVLVSDCPPRTTTVYLRDVLGRKCSRRPRRPRRCQHVCDRPFETSRRRAAANTAIAWWFQSTSPRISIETEQHAPSMRRTIRRGHILHGQGQTTIKKRRVKEIDGRARARPQVLEDWA